MQNNAQQGQDLTRTNDIKIAGVLEERQVTPTFSKQVLMINSYDTKTKQPTVAEMEIYIKPDIIAQNNITMGDTLIVTGFVGFNFWNGKSFPRLVATGAQVIAKGQGAAQPSQVQQQVQQPMGQPVTPTTPNYNAPQAAGNMPGIPAVPDIPMP